MATETTLAHLDLSKIEVAQVMGKIVNVRREPQTSLGWKQGLSSAPVDIFHQMILAQTFGQINLF